MCNTIRFAVFDGDICEYVVMEHVQEVKRHKSEIQCSNNTKVKMKKDY